MSISAFPPEILSTVFSFLLDPYTRGPSYHKQFAFSQVCQSWRSIALADPTLWRVLKSRNTPPKWVPELIRRSRASNLDVELTDGVHPDTLQAIATHFSGIGILRVSQYSLNFANSILHGCAEAISTQELPLRVLEAASRSIFDSNGFQIPTPLDYDLAAIIVRSPRLQELTLNSGGSGLWGVPPPSSLTTLKLDSVERPSLEAFLNVLRQTPNLRHLYLGHCGPKDGIAPLPPLSTHKVDLPHLTSVRMWPIRLPNECFLQYLNFPAGRVNLTFENGAFPITAQPVPVIRYISDRFHHTDRQFRWPAVCQLRVDIWSGNIKLDFNLSSGTTQAKNFEEWRVACDRLDDEADITLSFQYPVNGYRSHNLPDTSCIPLFIQLSCNLPLRNLEVLHLQGFPFEYFTPQNFTDLLGDLQELVYLEAPASSHALWKALEEMQKGVQPPAVGFLPKLRYVSVNMRADNYSGIADETRAAGLNWIREWLTARVVNGSDKSKLVRLELAYCEYESFEGAIPGFENFANVVLYTNYDY